MDILEKLFGTAARVKMMRLFLFNPDTPFDTENIIYRIKESPANARREVALLSSIGLIHKRAMSIAIPATKSGPARRRKVSGWILTKEFGYINELRNFLLNTKLAQNSEIIKRLQKSGKMKLVILAGLFIQNADSRLDLFVVGDGIRKAALENAVKTLESEIGKELRYVSFDTAEFNYRISMYDKLVRDVLDFPHEKILNKVNNQL